MNCPYKDQRIPAQRTTGMTVFVLLRCCSAYLSQANNSDCENKFYHLKWKVMKSDNSEKEITL